MPMAGCEVFFCLFTHREVRDPGNWGHAGDTGRWPGEGCPCYSFLLDRGRVGTEGATPGQPAFLPAPSVLLSSPGKGWILVP